MPVTREMLEGQLAIVRGDIQRLEAALAMKREREQAILINLSDPTLLPKKEEAP
jgi:hypothetical protein